MPTNHSQTIIWDPDLISRYNISGPRYTSYPTAVQFHELSQPDFEKAITSCPDHNGLLSLYVHIPFCARLCYYCACNKVTTKDKRKAAKYIECLEKEIKHYAPYFKDRQVKQLHWGGGTPTFLSVEQMYKLSTILKDNFNLVNDDSGEYSIEIDPREADRSVITELRQIGFNRISIGVQDFNPQVQAAVNRVQSEQQVLEVLETAREQHYHSVSFDLIYGLPYQTIDSFAETLEKVIEMSPDRLAVFNYAHLPQRFTPQRRIDPLALPSAKQKLDILHYTIEHLIDAGYVYIGMDHFAKPDDELAIAQRNGELQRNFQGYSTNGHSDLLGLGASSISYINRCYSQNHKDLSTYQDAITRGDLAVEKGYQLNLDDRVRQKVILALSCQFVVDGDLIAAQYGIEFDKYFAEELARLKPMEEDGLVEVHGNKIHVKPVGRLLVRPICMVFDNYLHPHSQQSRFSKVI